MTLELNPVDVKCNLKCTYCYENPMRDLLPSKGYDVDLMLAQAKSEFILFGGEPLLVPLVDLEKFFKFGFEKYGKNGIQTNGTLIIDRHIELFLKYKVHVGISVDGPEELNDARKLAASIEGTHKATSKTIEAIETCCKSGVNTSLIITIHRLNGIGEARTKLKKFILQCQTWGVRGIRLHPLENDNSDSLVLSDAENIEAFLDLKSMPVEFDIFKDIENLLTKDNPNASCVWNGCDPYTTPAVHGVDGDGSLSNCGRTNKDGISYRKSDSWGGQRTEMLFKTPQEFGGCAGCEFFYACKGQCPGEGINGDWRNRSSNCELYKALFRDTESRLIFQGIEPISINSTRRSILEKKLLDKGDQLGYNEGHLDTHDDWYKFEVEIR